MQGGSRGGFPPRLRRARGSAGLTLPEVLMSVVILGIVMASFTSVVNSAQYAFRHTRNRAQAIAIAEELTEQLLIMDASDPALEVDSSHTALFDRSGRRTEQATEAFFSARWSISPHETVANIRRIDLTVSWEESGTPRQIGWFTFRN